MKTWVLKEERVTYHESSEERPQSTEEDLEEITIEGEGAKE